MRQQPARFHLTAVRPPRWWNRYGVGVVKDLGFPGNGRLPRLSRGWACGTMAVRMATVMLFLTFSCILQSACSATPGGETGVPSVFEDAQFRGSHAAWIATHSGDLLWTMDGGAAWHKVPGDSLDHFRRVSFIDTTNGWALNSKAEVLRTRDGGQVWSAIGKLDQGTEYRPGIDTEIRFVDDTHGWAFDATLVWTTDDGGVTWKRSPPSIRLDGELATVHRGQFLSSQVGWLSGGIGLICQTLDGGVTWRARRLARSKEDIGALFFISPKIGWAAEWPRGTIYHTIDAGETWQPQDSPIQGVGIGSICFLNENVGWAAGHLELNGTRTPYKSIALLLHTQDGGRSWAVLRTDEGETMSDAVYFGDPKHGWLLGTSRTQEYGSQVEKDKLWRTTDGGSSWRLSLDAESAKSLVSPTSR